MTRRIPWLGPRWRIVVTAAAAFGGGAFALALGLVLMDGAQRPGAMAFLGVCPPGENPARAHSCHSNRMMLDEDALRAGSAMYAALAIEYLTSGLASGETR